MLVLRSLPVPALNRVDLCWYLGLECKLMDKTQQKIIICLFLPNATLHTPLHTIYVTNYDLAHYPSLCWHRRNRLNICIYSSQMMWERHYVCFNDHNSNHSVRKGPGASLSWVLKQSKLTFKSTSNELRLIPLQLYVLLVKPSFTLSIYQKLSESGHHKFEFKLKKKNMSEFKPISELLSKGRLWFILVKKSYVI